MEGNNREAFVRLSEFVIERRHYLKFRQQDLAERSEISIGWISSLEVGRLKHLPLSDTLRKLAKGIQLAGETPGALYNFMELVLAGSFNKRVVQQVATGKLQLDHAISDAIKGKGLSEETADGKDPAASIFFERQDRSQRLELILEMLRQDLPEKDFILAKMLLQRFYEGDYVAPSEQAIPSASPRRRKVRRSSILQGGSQDEV